MLLDYDKIVLMVEREIVLDKIDMDLESIRNPVLQSKYLKIFTDCSFALDNAESEFKKVRKQRWDYYSGKAPDEVYINDPLPLVKILKNEVKDYVDVDDKVEESRLKMKYYERLQDYLDKILKVIGNRQWDIKNIVDWRKFSSGVV